MRAAPLRLLARVAEPEDAPRVADARDSRRTIKSFSLGGSASVARVSDVDRRIVVVVVSWIDNDAATTSAGASSRYRNKVAQARVGGFGGGRRAREG